MLENYCIVFVQIQEYYNISEYHANILHMKCK